MITTTMSVGELIRVLWMRLGICLKAVSKTASPFMSGELKLIFNGIGLNRIKWFSVISLMATRNLVRYAES